MDKHGGRCHQGTLPISTHNPQWKTRQASLGIVPLLYRAVPLERLNAQIVTIIIVYIPLRSRIPAVRQPCLNERLVLIGLLVLKSLPSRIDGVAQHPGSAGNNLLIKNLGITVYAPAAHTQHGGASVETEVHRDARLKS